MFELAQTMGAHGVAMALNPEGYRCKSGARYDRRAVQASIGNPHYAGRSLEGRPLLSPSGGAIEPIVPAAQFDAVQDASGRRDWSAAARKRAADGMPHGGRPATRYVLTKLGRCTRCGGTMYARTSPYERRGRTVSLSSVEVSDTVTPSSKNVYLTRP